MSGSWRRYSLQITTALTSVLLVTAASSAYAAPMGGTVTGGNAAISSDANRTTINQTSQRAVIDWNSFNVNANETVQFVQPSASAIALNRIHDSGASAIDGQLLANGNVWLINPNGIVFGKNAKVNVGSLLATASNISNSDFMAGRNNFTQGGNPNATIENDGSITVADTGLVTLAAPNVVNNGRINAKLGKVTLASGDIFTIDPYGDGLINLQASPAITNQLVSNSGSIIADGGNVVLTMAAATNTVNSLINMDGLITVDGEMSGDGGKVSITSPNGWTDFSGTITARGGSTSGNGGMVETSGKTLSATGHVVTTAPHGNTGMWLLDPATLNVVSGGGSDITASTVDPGTIVTALSGTNVTLQADSSITVSNAIDASGNGSGGNLILNTPTDYLNAPITLKSGSTLSGSATIVNVGASGKVQNGVDAAASGGTVNLAAATYALSSQITIAKNLTLNGDNASGSILNGQNSTRVMEIDGTGGGITVGLNRLTMENGNGTGTNDNTYGGGLLVYAEGSNHATVSISKCAISGNTAAYGGGIFNDGLNNGNATLTIGDSTISNNSITNTGGGIYNWGSLTINDSTISGNSAGGPTYGGGGIFNDGGSGNAELTITNSTISGNSASAHGGGIYNLVNGGSATVMIGSTILAGNTAGASESDYYISDGGTLTSNGHNLFGQNSIAGGFTGNGTTDILLTGNINTVLGSLASNGGPTQTMALVASSPAIAAGGANSGYQIDQRGLARPLSGQISIGAYEYNDAGNPFVITSTSDTSGTNIGQLRTAFAYSNNNPYFNPGITFDSTTFATPQTITLGQGEFTISSSLTLNGPTSGVTLDANHASRVMEIDGTSGGITVGLNRLTLQNGNGGGTTYSGYGGGLLVYSASGNHAAVTIGNSTISGNSATNAGAIYNFGESNGNVTLTISTSTISGNSATNAGAIINDGQGGSGTLTINNSTISNNSDANFVGGILNAGSGGIASVMIGDTILAGNTTASSESDYDKYDAAAALTSNGHNLFGQNGNAGGFTGNGTTDILVSGAINTVLGTLGNYGGPTQTMPLVVGSPAYLTGGTRGSVTTDQRGQARGSVISIGAYDYVPTSLVVNSMGDTSKDIIGGSTTTLRDAFYYSNVGAISNPTITFDSTVFATPQTITLGQSEFTISSSLTLNGPTAGVTLDAHNASRVMEIDGTVGGITVGLNRLTLENGNGTGTNETGLGGGLLIFAEAGNHATVTLSNSTVSGNTAPSYGGGGIYNDGYNGGHSAMAINNSTISGNSASTGYGGGIANDGNAGNATMTISDSTISNNSATTVGGGIYNSAPNGGSATLTIGNTILAGNNISGIESDFTNNSATLNSNGYNLFGQSGNAGGFTGNGTTDILLSGNINTVLASLGNYGGPTQTMALVLASAAIDAGDPAQVGMLDQRGFVRGSPSAGTGSASDIGAYEAAILHVCADDKEITYGQSAPSFTYTLNSGPSGHLTGGVALTTNQTNAGTYNGDIGIGTLSLTSNNYLLDFTSGQYKVDQRTVTVNPTSGQSKIYGTADPTLTYSTATATGTTGLVNGDTLAGGISYAGAGQYTNVGTYATTLGNLSNSNYNIVLQASPPTFAITARTVTVDPTSGQSKIYGTVDPTLTYSTATATGTMGLVNSDALSGHISYIGAGQFTNVGSYATTLGNLSNSNYNIVLQASPPTFAITARTVTVDPTSGQSKIYGVVDPTLTYATATATGTTGLVNGDTLSGGISYTGAGQFTNVGNYATTLGNLSNSNYNIVLQASPPTFGITARTVTVDPTSGQSKIYGTVDPTLTYATATATGTTGLVNGDTLSGHISYGGAGQFTNVGNYATTLGNLSNSNYTIVLQASPPTFAITARTVTVDPTSGQTKMYGAVDPTLTYSTATATGTTGLVNGGTLSGGISYAGAGQYTTVGNYATTLGNLSNSNYNIVLQSSPPTFGITPASLTITANNASKDYGMADPSFTVSYSGFVGSDSSASLTTSPTVACTGCAGTSTTAGGHMLTPFGAVDINYTISYVGGIFTVNPAPVSAPAASLGTVPTTVQEATATQPAYPPMSIGERLPPAPVYIDASLADSLGYASDNGNGWYQGVISGECPAPRGRFCRFPMSNKPQPRLQH